MSRPNKPMTTSGIVSKPAPTSWKDRIPAEEYENLRNTFNIFDQDGSGTIDPVEINTILEKLGLTTRNVFVLNIVTAMKDKNKPIKFDQFLDIVCGQVGQVKTKDGLRKVFAMYDQNEDGVIDFEEFKVLAHRIHENMNDEELMQMMHSTFINCKTSNNETFNFEEFYQVVTKFNK